MRKLRSVVFLPTLGRWVLVVVLPARPQPSGREWGPLGGGSRTGDAAGNGPHCPCTLEVQANSSPLTETTLEMGKSCPSPQPEDTGSRDSGGRKGQARSSLWIRATSPSPPPGGSERSRGSQSCGSSVVALDALLRTSLRVRAGDNSSRGHVAPSDFRTALLVSTTGSPLPQPLGPSSLPDPAEHGPAAGAL